VIYTLKMLYFLWETSSTRHFTWACRDEKILALTY